jgi:MFS family permease
MSESLKSSEQELNVASIRKRYILPVITFTTFAGTSLWFAGNAVVRDIQKAWVLGDNIVGYVTSSVQVGFIVGTAVFALTGIADQYPPARVFCVCCLVGAFFNASIYLFAFALSQLLFLRFLIGFCLAGTLPLSLKIVKGWYDTGLGFATGCVIAALAAGTALPHLIKGAGGQLPWGATLISVSILASIGGIGMWLLVPDGPLLKKGVRFNPNLIVEIYRDREYLASSIGYYAHMWEQYTFWSLLPTLIGTYSDIHDISWINTSIASFFVIFAGAVGSFATGWATKYVTNSFAAAFNISLSGFFGIIHPIFFGYPSFFLYMLLLLVWGWTVTADSAQFGALASRACKPELLGTALTVYNCVGYFVTVISIQLCQSLTKFITMQYVSIPIAMGPIIGAIIISRRANREGIWLIPESKTDSGPVKYEESIKEVELAKKPLIAEIQQEKVKNPVQQQSVAPEVFFTIGDPEEPEPVVVGKQVESPAQV